MARPDSTLRFPLTRVLGSIAHVRTLRELTLHGGALSAPSLTTRTRLSKRAVQLSLQVLESMKVVEVLGADRSRLYRLRRQHPLSSALVKLFRDEEERFGAVIGALRKAIDRCSEGVLAVWLYGSVARGEDRADSDLDVAVVVRPAAASKVQTAMREALDEAEAKLAFSAAVVVVGTDDVLRLAAARDGWWFAIRDGATVVTGDPPDILLQRLKRRAGTQQRAA